MAYQCRTKYTFVPQAGLDTGQDTIVVPDESLSIRELLLRFQRGQPPIGTNREPVYDENQDSWDIDPQFAQNRDLSDLDNFKQEFIETLNYELQKSANRRSRAKSRNTKSETSSKSAEEKNQGTKQQDTPA